jgi:TRAP-type C4-dicarboxylate transport system substrate-binding protein
MILCDYLSRAILEGLIRPALLSMKLFVSRFVIPVCIALACISCEPPPEQRSAVVAGTTFPDTEGEQQWLSFEERLNAASNGTVPLRLLIYGQLGSEDQIVSGIRRGRVQFANLSAMAVSVVVPEMALLYAPFLFDNAGESDFIYDNYLTDFYRDLLAQKGFYLVSWYEIGFINIYGVAPILSPADVAGQRFRVGAGPAARLFAQSVGADVIPLGFADVVSSLQTGLIAAGEQSVSLYARTGIASEAPHLTLTEHAFGVSAIVASKAWWDTLSSAEQGWVMASWPTAATSRRAVRAESDRDLLNGQELGIVVHPLTEAQRDAWRQATAGVTEKLIGTIGGRSREVYELIQKGKADYAALRNP